MWLGIHQNHRPARTVAAGRPSLTGPAQDATITLVTHPWTTPELTGVGRLPMHSVRHTDRLELDGTWRFQLLARPEDEPGRKWRDIEVPGCWTMQDTFDKPHYTNVQMPFAGSAAGDPRGEPDRRVRADLHGPDGVGGPTGRPPCRRGRERPHRHPQRGRDRGRQGRPPRVRVRRHRPAQGRDQHPDAPRREVVGRDLRRGPGPVVARWASPAPCTCTRRAPSTWPTSPRSAAWPTTSRPGRST